MCPDLCQPARLLHASLQGQRVRSFGRPQPVSPLLVFTQLISLYTAPALINYTLCIYSEDLTNPVAAIPPIDAGLIKLYDDIRTTVDQEAEIISMVFPNPAAVFQVFIQRVFEQSVGVRFKLYAYSLRRILNALDRVVTPRFLVPERIDSTIY